MINYRLTDIIARFKESTMRAWNLKMLLLFGSLTTVLLSGVIIAVAAAEKSPQQKDPQSSLAYSKSTVAVNFDPKKGQLPEGLVVNNKDIFVAWAPIGQVAKIDKNNLTVSKYGSWPTIPPNTLPSN